MVKPKHDYFGAICATSNLNILLISEKIKLNSVIKLMI